MFTEGATLAQIDAYWGTDAQQAVVAEAAANVELVKFCQEELIKTVNKYADQLGVTDECRECASGYIHDLIGDMFGRTLRDAANEGAEV